MNANDWNGHVPGEDSRDPREDPAARLLASMIEMHESVYRLAEQLGVPRDELDRCAADKRNTA